MKDLILEIEGLPCRPCGKHGHMRCPDTHFKCMKEIKPDYVEKAVADFLETGKD